jgi:tRNA(Arg) A34 adenosine deaminase TadA
VVAVYARVPEEEARMRLAVDLARENVVCGTGGPFGAAIVADGTGRVVAVGVNGVERLQSSLAHAEVVALAQAEAREGSYSLATAGDRLVLYTSSEPCAMCLGAVLWSGITRIVYAAPRADAESIGFDEGPPLRDPVSELRRRGIVLEQGPLREEAGAVLRLYAERGGLIYNG